MLFRQLFERESSTYTYLLADEESRDAVLIDPVRETFERDAKLVDELGLQLRYCLETHIHADHVTASGQLRRRFGAETVVCKGAGAECADHQAEQGQRFRFGRHQLEVRPTPGHTAGCLSYVLDEGEAVFTGDTLLVRGTGRTDFQQGDASQLYRSIQEQLFSLPDHTRVYPAHDYRGFSSSTIGEEKAHNPRCGGGKSESEFVAIMEQLKLAYPRKLDEALPANLQCGLLEKAPEGVNAAVDWAEVRDGARDEVGPAWLWPRQRGVRLVDVRSSDEYVQNHIEGSELVPLETLASAAADWPRDAVVVCVCRSGRRSLDAVETLRGMGFERALSLAGGVLRWSDEGLPLRDGSDA